jgi:hypothetical protein
MKVWFENTTPEQRGPIVAGIVLLGLVTPAVMITTLVVLGVLLVRLRRSHRIGIFQRAVLAGLALVHAAFWFARWALLNRLRRKLEPFDEPTG